MITDNPVQGDERNFVQARLSQAGNETYADELLVHPGDDVVCFAWVNNGAANDVPARDAVVRGLRARVVTGANNDHDHWVSVVLESENAGLVWDDAALVSRADVSIDYVRGSAFFHTAGSKDGFDTGDLEGAGTLLGLDGPDGRLPVGTSRHGLQLGSGYLTFRIHVSASST